VFDQKVFKETLLESVKELVDADVVIGQPIVSGNTTVIPVFKASIGIMSGGGMSDTTLGGAAGGVSVTPVTFIVIENGAVKILSAGDTSMVERLIDAAPALIDKIAGILSSEDGEDEAAKYETP
jgi:uncharacterized spore protein YtfJ